jgi:hypothetical protein
MKRLKEFLDFLITLRQAWPILVWALLLLLSLVLGLTNAANKTIQFSIPLPLLVAAIAFAIYPILKFIQWLASKPMKPFENSGLLWKPSKLSFHYPKPLCPKEGCGCEIIVKVVPSVNIGHAAATNLPILTAHTKYSYTFECPIHGVISGVPDEDIEVLQHKARMVQNNH